MLHIPWTSRTIRASTVSVTPGDKFPRTNSTMASIWLLHFDRYEGREFDIIASSTCIELKGHNELVLLLICCSAAHIFWYNCRFESI